jgi:transposase
MVKTAEKLRLSIANADRSGAGRPYPVALRREIVAYVEEQRRQGVGGVTASREIGVSAFSVARWKADKGSDSETGFRPVVLAEPIEVPISVERSRLVVHGPAGLRIEGLDLAALAELWRRLS